MWTTKDVPQRVYIVVTGRVKDRMKSNIAIVVQISRLSKHYKEGVYVAIVYFKKGICQPNPENENQAIYT